MKARITLIELKTPFHFFKLSMYALNILNQLKKTDYVDFKKTGIWTTHYTMTLWKSEGDLKTFATSGAHLKAMKESKSMAKYIKTITIDADELPDWKTAKELLASTKAVQYG